MNTTTVSPKFQVLIPKEVRESLNIVPGVKLTVFPYMGRIEMVPVKPIKEYFGIAKGMDTILEEEEDRLL